MARNDHSGNIQDASLQVSRALTAADGSVTSADIDLGTTNPATGDFDIGVKLPAITSALLASADTLTIELLNGSAASPTTVVSQKIITGDGSDTIAQTVRLALPRDAGRYCAVKFTSAGTTGDMSGITAVCGPLF